MRLRALLIIIFLAATPALAVIQVKLPLSKIYTTSSPVLVAKITRLNEQNRSMEAELSQALTGQSPGNLRLHLIEPASLFAQIKVGDPVVVFVAKGRGSNTASIHLANT